MKPSLGIFIPAYNAGTTLDAVLRRLPEDLRPRFAVIVVVDDGSRDDTAAVAKAWAGRLPALRVHSFPENRGYGAAVRQGLSVCREAGCDITVCLHADGQYPPERIGEFALHLEREGLDVLQGSRHRDGGALSGGMPLYKYAAGKILTGIENAAFGSRLTDPHSGMLFYSRRALETIPFDRLSGYFDFDLEVLACAQAAGLRLGELAIPTHYGAERSYLNPVRYGLSALRVAWRFRSGHYGRLLAGR